MKYVNKQGKIVEVLSIDKNFVEFRVDGIILTVAKNRFFKVYKQLDEKK